MKFFAVFAFAAVASAAYVPAPLAPIDTNAITFTSCSDGKESLLIKEIKITPDPPVLGKDVTMEIIGRLKKDIVSGSKANLKAYLGILKVADKDLDLCKDLNLSCPIMADSEKDQRIVTTLPASGAPAGVTLKVRVESTNLDGSNAFCLQGSLKFVNGKRMLPEQ